MDLKVGVIIIGSLLWDGSSKRVTWRESLDVKQKIPVKLPIRYGRLSSSRENTYSMVFSHDANDPKLNGQGYVVPYKQNIQLEQDFIDRMILLSDAENISSTRICKSWGVVCIAINSYLDEDKKDEIFQLWNSVVAKTKQQLSGNQREPEYDKFGEAAEQKSIDVNWMLTVDLNDLFKNELKHFDAVVATSNAVKLNSKGENKYPTVRQIARAIYDNDYLEYFLKNILKSIRTFQDRKIARALKRGYRMNLKNERRKFL